MRTNIYTGNYIYCTRSPLNLYILFWDYASLGPVVQSWVSANPRLSYIIKLRNCLKSFSTKLQTIMRERMTTLYVHISVVNPNFRY
jgi:hypothetical protein